MFTCLRGKVMPPKSKHAAAPSTSPSESPLSSVPGGSGSALEERLHPPAASLPDAVRRGEILRRLSELFPDPRTELDHTSPFQLLIATILSAQSTDKGVNLVTPALFAAYPDAHAMSRATPAELEPYINRLGLYHNKAKAIAETARMLVALYGGEVPRSLEELTVLPGVGRKTANVVMSNAFGVPAIAVDTHVFRVANRLGLAHAKTVEDVEQQLMRVIPRENWTDAHHWLILFGRRVCAARKPACSTCILAELCPSRQLQS